MAFRNLIQEQVSVAFDILDDLKETVVFYLTTKADYDFELGGVAVNTRTFTVNAIVEFSDKGRGVGDTSDPIEGPRVKLIVDKSSFTEDFSKFDIFRLRSVDYKITKYTDNGFTAELEGMSQ